jgi:hypothetical protein
MPTFCRHNRFVERCPICSKDLPGFAGGQRPAKRAPARGQSSPAAAKGSALGHAKGAARRPGTRRPRATDVRVYRDSRKRARDDGYRCELVPGLRSSEDARRLLAEIAFSGARLKALAAAPPGAYALAARLAREEHEIERASWLCFLTAYLSPLEAEDPFVEIVSFAQVTGGPPLDRPEQIDDEAVEALRCGPRTCHQPGRGAATLRAYLAWAARAGSQRQALCGEGSWSDERRFERIFERLAIPGFPRWGRFELLTLIGRLGLYELRAGSLQLASAAPTDPVLAAAKRIFGIGDPLLLERRAKRLAGEASIPLEALDLALFNWLAPQRATLGFPHELSDEDALAQDALALDL